MPLFKVSITGCFLLEMEYSRNVNVIPTLMTELDYEEILKCYEGETDAHASTSFEFGLMNDLYYQLFHSYNEVDK